ncbi:Alg9-like mannosyltransferase family [Zea mays]|uniref:Alg9-like mannosyltransferase family n=1 Tax=Zea mays TaxID=4577 RepID=A0A1D6NPG7_MAIZE|nr:Alg9-like mannosyltransferase family [Zea mays]
MSLFHQRETEEEAMYYLPKEANDGRVNNVFFLMPCHSTPYYSTLHYKNLPPMRFCTALLVIAKGSWMSQIVSLQVDLSLWARFFFGNLSAFSHIVLFEFKERHAPFLRQHAIVP